MGWGPSRVRDVGAVTNPSLFSIHPSLGLSILPPEGMRRE